MYMVPTIRYSSHSSIQAATVHWLSRMFAMYGHVLNHRIFFTRPKCQRDDVLPL